MGAVGVHLHHDVKALLQGPAEASQIGGPEAFLAESMHHVDQWISRSEFLGQIAGSVRRVVVHNENLGGVHAGTYPIHNRRDGVDFVEGGNDDQDAAKVLETHPATLCRLVLLRITTRTSTPIAIAMLTRAQRAASGLPRAALGF